VQLTNFGSPTASVNKDAEKSYSGPRLELSHTS